MKKKGYIIFISILLLSSIALSISIGLFTGSIFGSQKSLTKEEGTKARLITETCAEKTIETLKTNQNYTGSETLNIDNGTCEILTIEGSGNYNRVIKIKGKYKRSEKKIKIEIKTINPKTKIETWQEVKMF